jgi:hypothetical protein
MNYMDIVDFDSTSASAFIWKTWIFSRSLENDLIVSERFFRDFFSTLFQFLDDSDVQFNRNPVPGCPVTAPTAFWSDCKYIHVNIIYYCHVHGLNVLSRLSLTTD